MSDVTSGPAPESESEKERGQAAVSKGDKTPPEGAQDIDITEIAADQPEAEVTSYGTVTINKTIEINPTKRLKKYDVGEVKAYEAIGTGKSAGSHFALVCESHIGPRMLSREVFSGFVNPSLVRLATSGIVYWPPAKEERFVFVYEDVLGKPLVEKGAPLALGLKHDDVMNLLLKPMITVLRDFRDKDFVHGNIRSDNIFLSRNSGAEKIILGECLSTPPSYAQPALFEPVERAMADPVAKGLGKSSDDLYALGVCIGILLRHHDPLEGMSHQDIIRYKLEHGSYAAITGKDRFTGAILELMRGLLNDDSAQRWNFDEVESWMDGQRLSPKQNVKKIKAARPLSFNGKKYIMPSLLAYDLENNVAEASQMVESGELEQWLERSLEIKHAGELIEKAIRSASELGKGSGYKERLANRISVLLDPRAPLRLYGKRMFPEGIGNALTETILGKKDVQPFADMISDQTVLYWLDVGDAERSDASALISRFETARAYVKLRNMGHGIERCLYILNPECPCLSEKFKDYYVLTPEQLIMAFEDMCAKGKAPVRFLDRHVAAFLSVRDRNMIDPHLVDINSEREYLRIIGEIKTLASIQQRSRMDKFPEIAKTIAKNLGPVYSRLHDRDQRRIIAEKIDKVRDSGDLSKISQLIESEDIYKRDYRNFRNAMLEYSALKKEKGKLEEQLEKQGQFGRETGRQIAALFSAGFSAFIIFILALFIFTSS